MKGFDLFCRAILSGCSISIQARSLWLCMQDYDIGLISIQPLWLAWLVRRFVCTDFVMPFVGLSLLVDFWWLIDHDTCIGSGLVSMQCLDVGVTFIHITEFGVGFASSTAVAAGLAFVPPSSLA